MLGHELNNSLAPVASLARTGQRLVATGAYDEVPTVLQTIYERVEHLRTFLHGYGALARLPRPRPAEVKAAGVLSRLQTLFPGIVVVTSPHTIFVDEGQLEQVMVNLVKNAAEAGSVSEDIAIDTKVDADGSVRISVSDRGHGLSDEVLSSALVPFFSTKEGGAGLGLAISREIVENHGGRLRLHARDGGGAQVFVRLPGRSGRLNGDLSWSIGR